MSYRAEQKPTCSSSEIRGRGFRFSKFQLNNPASQFLLALTNMPVESLATF